MSPPTLRRYRAERLLRQEFEGLRGRVLASVRGRLGASGVRLEEADLDDCYGQAWQGLYAALLAGQEISNPPGWLVVVTFRRAIEEHRARMCAPRERHGDPEQARDGRVPPETDPARERDVAGDLDDRIRLRQLFEGLRGRLSARECEAAVLCYLQGLTRAEAAFRMGLSEARMDKLMEGRGAGRPGVAGKVGALVEIIRAGGWCEEQGSLMRALAYGILDPEGERYRLALLHRSECPACRAYVVSLRGLAAVLPPLFPPAGLAAATLTLAGEGAHAGLGTAAGGGVGATGGSGAGVQLGGGIGAMSVGGAAGVGGAGGSWLLAGGLGAKFAVGCLLALGVGAGCVALDGGLDHVGTPRHGRDSRRSSDSGVKAGPTAESWLVSPAAIALRSSRIEGAQRPAPSAAAAARAQAGSGREFGPEGMALSARPADTGLSVPVPRARSASTALEAVTSVTASAALSPAGGGPPPEGPSSGAPSAAAREFAPG
jgi:DNA-directed RNA polymerase specialized sigma24 family protein